MAERKVPRVWRLLAAITVSLVSACATEPGASPREIKPQTVTVTLMSPQQEQAMRARGVEAAAVPAAHPCLMIVPVPRGYDDTHAWHLWFHELRHCNGESHDERGVWR